MSDGFDPVDGVWGVIDGVPITEELIAEAVANAEAGFPGVVARPVGRPLLGERPARSVAVRLDPVLDAALRARASATDESTSELIREALRAYLNVA